MHLDVRASEEDRAILARLASHLGINLTATMWLAVREKARREGLDMATNATYIIYLHRRLDRDGEHIDVMRSRDGGEPVVVAPGLTTRAVAAVAAEREAHRLAEAHGLTATWTTLPDHMRPAVWTDESQPRSAWVVKPTRKKE